MSELDKLIKDIETLRKNLHKITHDKQYNFQDAEVLTASRMLNACIAQYDKMLKNKMNES